MDKISHEKLEDYYYYTPILMTSTNTLFIGSLDSKSIISEKIKKNTFFYLQILPRILIRCIKYIILLSENKVKGLT